MKQDYIHLGAVSHVWATPTTKNPQLEPVFAAAMHAVEIGDTLRSNNMSSTYKQVLHCMAVHLDPCIYSFALALAGMLMMATFIRDKRWVEIF